MKGNEELLLSELKYRYIVCWLTRYRFVGQTREAADAAMAMMRFVRLVNLNGAALSVF